MWQQPATRLALSRASSHPSQLPLAGQTHPYLHTHWLPLQVNYVRTRLMGQLGGLDAAVPDIGKLARELQVRCRLAGLVVGPGGRLVLTRWLEQQLALLLAGRGP